jgi:hypothetical protein
MKILAIVLIILAVIISVLPQFTDCQSQGLMLTLDNGTQVPMKCHWTAQAEIGLGVPLFVLGILLFISRGREARAYLGILGAVLGLFVILFPTVMIGVCSAADHYCNLLMKPALVLAGSLVIVASLAAVIVSLAGSKKTSTG